MDVSSQPRELRLLKQQLHLRNGSKRTSRAGVEEINADESTIAKFIERFRRQPAKSHKERQSEREKGELAFWWKKFNSEKDSVAPSKVERRDKGDEVEETSLLGLEDLESEDEMTKIELDDVNRRADEILARHGLRPKMNEKQDYREKYKWTGLEVLGDGELDDLDSSWNSVPQYPFSSFLSNTSSHLDGLHVLEGVEKKSSQSKQVEIASSKVHLYLHLDNGIADHPRKSVLDVATHTSQPKNHSVGVCTDPQLEMHNSVNMSYSSLSSSSLSLEDTDEKQDEPDARETVRSLASDETLTVFDDPVVRLDFESVGKESNVGINARSNDAEETMQIEGRTSLDPLDTSQAVSHKSDDTNSDIDVSPTKQPNSPQIVEEVTKDSPQEEPDGTEHSISSGELCNTSDEEISGSGIGKEELLSSNSCLESHDRQEEDLVDQDIRSVSKVVHQALDELLLVVEKQGRTVGKSTSIENEDDEKAKSTLMKVPQKSNEMEYPDSSNVDSGPLKGNPSVPDDDCICTEETETISGLAEETLTKTSLRLEESECATLSTSEDEASAANKDSENEVADVESKGEEERIPQAANVESKGEEEEKTAAGASSDVKNLEEGRAEAVEVASKCLEEEMPQRISNGGDRNSELRRAEVTSVVGTVAEKALDEPSPTFNVDEMQATNEKKVDPICKLLQERIEELRKRIALLKVEEDTLLESLSHSPM